MGDVDHHAKAVHLSDHLSPEVGEAVVPSLVQYSVGPVVGVVPSQGHIADSQLVKLAQHSQVVFDGVAALDTQYGRALALRRQPPYVGGGAGQPYLQGILSAELLDRIGHVQYPLYGLALCYVFGVDEAGEELGREVAPAHSGQVHKSLTGLSAQILAPIYGAVYAVRVGIHND